jgi:hypothetical protein
MFKASDLKNEGDDRVRRSSKTSAMGSIMGMIFFEDEIMEICNILLMFYLICNEKEKYVKNKVFSGNRLFVRSKCIKPAVPNLYFNFTDH